MGNPKRNNSTDLDPMSLHKRGQRRDSDKSSSPSPSPKPKPQQSSPKLSGRRSSTMTTSISSNGLALSQRLRHAKSTTLDQQPPPTPEDDSAPIRPHLRKSASSRFGKALLPAWLGGSGTNSNPVHPLTVSAPSETVEIPEKGQTPIDDKELDKKFESLLASIPFALFSLNDRKWLTFIKIKDELNMKDAQRDKLRELPRERKLYLLQQNQQANTSNPTADSPDSLQPAPRISPVVKRLLPRQGSNQQLNGINKPDKAALPPTIHRPTASSSTSAAVTPTPTNPHGDRRAATYKFNRRRPALGAATNRSSKVGSMILEFDALAQQEQGDVASSWLLLDDKKSVGRPSPLQPVTPNPSTALLAGRVNEIRGYQSLTRKDGSQLAAALIAAAADGPNAKRTADRNSPYFYVERLRNRYVIQVFVLDGKERGEKLNILELEIHRSMHCVSI